MGIRKTTGWAAAGLAAVMIAAPLPALAEDADAATGTLTVTRFDDRYADGLYDTTKTAPGGDVDRLNTSHAAQLIDVNGTRHYLSADEDGLYRFTDVPVGPAKLYLGYPNNPPGEVLFDATGATDATQITRLATAEYFGPQGVLDITIDEDGEERLIGMSALRLVADVVNADGTPTAGLATVELGSGDDWYPATEYSFQPGTYEAFQPSGYVRHLPGELGVRVTPPAGFQVAEVTAGDVNAFTVTERDGAYWFSSTQVLNYFWNPAFTVTLEPVPDKHKPTATLVSPTTAGPFRALSVQVDATDDTGLTRIVANIYKDGTLVKSTQSAVSGTSASHTATVTLPDGDYTVKYNSQDATGKISKTTSFAFTIDATAPKATVKSGEKFTLGADGVYDLVSFKLSDAGKIDKVSINGKVKDLTNNAWSDVNFIKPGTFGAVEGTNTLVVYDVAGNTQTTTFTLN
ncbi:MULTISPECIES: hypothetical protein [unclassified Microbacterium]|uniref:hypothetical protein n=1 Tax=unclassified Microbacterium TaxID=2609290 RepID=UPI000EA9AA09|nr:MULTISPECIES: hypothetical protein [unclassified Microbacterium]MBT2483388.1 hypothetical protein [Microbacterium sp. ISL-108]RKN66420.1 hypothetical protein D7252_01605 [Microbacterium sp. CGR2]